ncbi:MAG: HAD-IA family hydrolase [Iamia sp.]
MDPAVDLLLLDVNGVLYAYDPEVRIATLARALDVGADAVRDALFTSGLEDAADAGDITPADYLAAAGQRLGVDVARDPWAEALAAAVTPDRDVLDLVGSVLGPVRGATLSNNGLLVRELVDRIYPEVADLGIEVHVAAEYGEAKPDRDVYRDACADLGVAPERAAFVDDKEDNAEGARRAGLRAHHFTTAIGLRAFLRDLGLEPQAGGEA